MAPDPPEWRLTALLVLDVVGYCRLMAADERGTHARLRAVRREIVDPLAATYHGRIIKHMGDGTLMAFGSAVNALEAALAILSAVRNHEAEVAVGQRMVFRIGLNLGDVIIDGDDVYGDQVNVPARVERLAPPGGICLTRTVADHVQGRVPCRLEPMETHHLKNIPHPVTLHRIRPGAAADVHDRWRCLAWRSLPWAAGIIAGAALVLGTVGLLLGKTWAG